MPDFRFELKLRDHVIIGGVEYMVTSVPNQENKASLIFADKVVLVPLDVTAVLKTYAGENLEIARCKTYIGELNEKP